MMSNHRRSRGFRTERVVASYLANWWPAATIERGSGKDIVNVPFDCEVKARTGFNPLEYLRQIKKRTDKTGELGFAVLRLNGQGEDAREYAALIRLGDLVELLHLKYAHIGYKPTESNITRCKICGGWMFQSTICKNCEGLK